MARKLTKQQSIVLHRITEGWPEALLPISEEEIPQDYLHVFTHHHCVDGDIVRCHRTVRTDTSAGSQVQGFKISRDGTHERFI